MLDDFYHYSFLGDRLFGSEDPCLLGHPKRVVEQFARSHGIRALITLTAASRDYGLPELQQHHVPMVRVPTREQVAVAVALVRQHLGKGERVWAHCQHGIDRTGCVIGSYLTSIGEPTEQVIAELFARFPERRRNPLLIQLWRPYADLIRSFHTSGSVPGSAQAGDRGADG